MRATIVVEDNIVLVDGVPQSVDCSPLTADNIHAVQWYDTFGEVEFITTFVDAPILDPETNEPTGETVKRPHREYNQSITDFTPYQPYVDVWMQKSAKAKLSPGLNTVTAFKSIERILGV